MAFESTRLGVQLPCGSVTVVPQTAQFPVAQLPAQFPGFTVQACYNVYTVCFGGSWICYWPSCLQTIVGCSWTLAAQPAPAGPPAVVPGSASVVSVEALGELRRQLEAQLEEIDEAEREIRAYQEEASPGGGEAPEGDS